MPPKIQIPNRKNLKFEKPIDESPAQQFEGLLKRHKISRDEYSLVKDCLGRVPTFTELGIFSAMWSEHCGYKSSRVHLKRFPTKGPHVVVGPGENAGVVRLEDDLCLAFKMESHNHPSYIEPYQGAATGVGGILRDVFCMGSRPIANLNCLRFGDRKHPKTSFLVANVVRGIGDYGNCVGIPTVGGNISYDSTYDGNCLVNAMTVGLIREDEIFKGFASGVGNLVVYVGSATGRDGIHGATMASGSFASDESQERSAIQVGDPFTEKLLIEATLEVLKKRLVVGIQDMGAAGLTSSAFEMAGRAGNGLLLDLERVPTRTTQMSPYELLLSESQERMLMVIEPRNWDALSDVLTKWQLPHAIIGTVTETGKIEVLFQGMIYADVPVVPLTDKAPIYKRPIKVASKSTNGAEFEKNLTTMKALPLQEVLSKILAADGFPDKIFKQYDRHIGSQTVLTSDHGGAAVLWIRDEAISKKNPNLGVGISTACNELYTGANAKLGSTLAVLKCARMLATVGAEPLGLTDCLNFGNPEDPEVMGQFSDAVDGISLACQKLGVPVVSGNVSLYNETDKKSIHPTPMIGMVGKISDVRNARPAIADTQCKDIYLLHPKNFRPTLEASFVSKLSGTQTPYGSPPEILWSEEQEAMTLLKNWNLAGNLAACRDVGKGGIAATVAKMSLAANAGLTLDLANVSADMDKLQLYFGEVGGTYVLQFKDDFAASFNSGLLKLTKIGTVHADSREWKIAGSIFDSSVLQKEFHSSHPL